MRAEYHDATGYQYAEIYAQWGDSAQALDWLEKAQRFGDPGLLAAKIDPLLEPIRAQPRYQTILAALKFPD